MINTLECLSMFHSCNEYTTCFTSYHVYLNFTTLLNLTVVLEMQQTQLKVLFFYFREE